MFSIRLLRGFTFVLICGLFIEPVFAQISTAKTSSTPNEAVKDVADVASGISRSKQSVQVPHSPSDQQIAARLKRIFAATGWFTEPFVESREGIVTLKGRVAQKSQREWAENLARDTEGVIAVINSIEVPVGEWFDLRPAEQETRGLMKRALSFTPYILASVVVLLIVAGLSMIAVRLGRRAAQRRIKNTLLIEIVAKLFALPVVLLGLYLVLRISGLTGVAVTLLGGTGAIGLVAGFAMKNILENYFSGVMLSVSNPYSVGDIITVNGKTGVVQTLTTRGTVLVDFDGNHIIIPNTTIYGTTVVNETVNPSIRVKFSIGLSFDESPKKVRDIVLSGLREAKDVLHDPESLVMMSAFAPPGVIYDVYFWIDSRKSSSMRMKSLVMELVRHKLCEAGIKIPGETRELFFRPESADDVRADLDFQGEPAETTVESQKLLREAEKGRTLRHGEKLI